MEWKFDMKYFDETSFYKSESKESGYKYYNLIRGGGIYGWRFFIWSSI